MGLNDLEKLLFERPDRCSECGGVLKYCGIGRYRCNNCGTETLDDYGKLREYFERHGPTPAYQVAKDLGFSREKVNVLLRRGTVELLSKD